MRLTQRGRRLQMSAFCVLVAVAFLLFCTLLTLIATTTGSQP